MMCCCFGKNQTSKFNPRIFTPHQRRLFSRMQIYINRAKSWQQWMKFLTSSSPLHIVLYRNYCIVMSSALFVWAQKIENFFCDISIFSLSFSAFSVTRSFSFQNMSARYSQQYWVLTEKMVTVGSFFGGTFFRDDFVHIIFRMLYCFVDFMHAFESWFILLFLSWRKLIFDFADICQNSWLLCLYTQDSGKAEFSFRFKGWKGIALHLTFPFNGWVIFQRRT